MWELGQLKQSALTVESFAMTESAASTVLEASIFAEVDGEFHEAAFGTFVAGECIQRLFMYGCV